MFGNFGISYVGIIYLLMLFIPNLFWIKNKPTGYSNENENKILLTFERVGEVLVVCTAVMFSNYNIKPWANRNIFLIISFIFMILYEIYWVRYFKSKHTLADFYSSLLGIPVAGATIPIIAFLLLGIYGNVIWLIISTVILGIGHIGIHIEHKKEISDSSN